MYERDLFLNSESWLIRLANLQRTVKRWACSPNSDLITYILIKLYLKLIFFCEIALKYNDKYCFYLCCFDSIRWPQHVVTGVSETYIRIKYFVLGQCAFRKLIFELNTGHRKSEKPIYATMILWFYNTIHYLSGGEGTSMFWN